VVLSFVLVSGCMPTKHAPEAWLNDKALVVQSLQDAHLANAKLGDKLDSLDNRVLSLERIVSKQTTQMQSLEATLSGLKNKSSLVTPPKKKRKSLRKKKRLRKKLATISKNLIIPSQNTNKKTVPKSNEKNAYTAAYLALKSGRYDEASAGFNAVVRTHPTGEYTDQAYYWLGESLVAQRRQKEALQAFSIVANKYPRSAKHPASLLKLATTYQNLQRSGDARAALARLIQEHPDSRSAERARLQLQSLSGAK
ncbi:MAG: tol-pal system protein YbgF, partial [Ghiorsea sp.]